MFAWLNILYFSGMKTSLCICLFFLILFFNVRAQHTDTLSVYFDQNQAMVTSVNKSLVDSFFNVISRNHIVQYVRLRGYCDTLGSDQYNLELSYKRVQSIKNYLDLEKPVSVFYDEVKGYGESTVQTQQAANYNARLNRCVQIIIHYTDIVAESPSPAPIPQAKNLTLSELFNDPDLEIGSNVTLGDLKFFGNSHYPLPQSMSVLKQVVKIFQVNLKLKVEIQGFICCTTEGMDLADNETGVYDLSVQRAKYVYDFLVKNKINPARLSFRGFGASLKYYPQELNRRVEFKIVNR
jgi:outer membrane protein OmpA-like peptidoglycan-associated protein